MLTRFPRRHLPAAAGVVAVGVFALGTAACALLAADSSGSNRVALVLLCVAGALCTLGVAACVAMVPFARRWWNRNVIRRREELADIAEAQRRTRVRVAELQAMVEELPGRRVVRSVDVKAAAALERSDEVHAEVIRLQAAVKALPDSPRIHKMLDVTAQTSATLIEHLRSESEHTRSVVAATQEEVASIRKELELIRKGLA